MDIYGVIHNQYAAALEDYSPYETDLPLYTREAMSGVVRLLSQACTCGSTAEVAKYLEPLILACLSVHKDRPHDSCAQRMTRALYDHFVLALTAATMDAFRDLDKIALCATLLDFQTAHATRLCAHMGLSLARGCRVEDIEELEKQLTEWVDAAQEYISGAPSTDITTKCILNRARASLHNFTALISNLQNYFYKRSWTGNDIFANPGW